MVQGLLKENFGWWFIDGLESSESGNTSYSGGIIVLMKTIFETFKRSVYDPVFYQNVAEESLSKGVSYYVKFSLILAVIVTTVLGVLLVPQGVVFLKNGAGDVVKNYFPPELSIKIKNGEVSVDVPEPYVLPGKDATLALLKEQGLLNMLVIDTKHDFDKKKFEEYKTFSLLTKNEIVTQSAKGQITIKQLDGFPNATVSQGWLLSLIEKLQDSVWYIIIGGLAGTFVVVLLGYLGYLGILLVFAVIPLLVAYLKKTPISYATAYKMSLYAILPAIALKTLLNIMGVVVLPSYFVLLVFMLVVTINMREVKNLS